MADSLFIPSANSSDTEVETPQILTPKPKRIRKTSKYVKKRKPWLKKKNKITSQNPIELSPMTPGSIQSSSQEMSHNPLSLSSQASLKRTIAQFKLGTPSSLQSSSKKIPLKFKLDDDDVITKAYTPEGNLVINSSVFQSLLNTMVICKNCKKGGMELLDLGRKASCSSRLLLKCTYCDSYKIFWSVSGHFGKSKITIGNVKIPKRNDMVYSSILGGRLIGNGLKNLMLYHNSINIPLPPSGSTYHDVQFSLMLAAEELAKNSMELAKKELCRLQSVEESEPVRLVASYDGAYQQRGEHSRYAFASAISIDTGKVLSYGVACNSCTTCSKYNNLLRDNKILKQEFDNWYETHSKVCPAIYSDLASVHLESAIAPQIVREAKERGIIFTGLVTDGDNKTHETLKNIYNGEENEIERFECLSHVVKRLKANLCKAQDKILKSSRSEKSSSDRDTTAEKKRDDKYKGQLTRDSTQHSLADSSKEIRTLSIAHCGLIALLYRRAVQQNKGDIDAIIQAVHAIPHHLGANNCNAEDFHRFCPKQIDTWCSYQFAILSGQPPPKHANYISQKSVDMVLKLFSDFQLDKESFIKKIASGVTSNHNEAIHSVLFRMVKKTEACGMDAMRLSSALAVIRYNDGFAGIRHLFEILGIDISDRMKESFTRLDLERVTRSFNIISEQRLRFKKKQGRGKKVKKQMDKHGKGYTSAGYTDAKKFSEESSESEDDHITIDAVAMSKEAASLVPIKASDTTTQFPVYSSSIAGPSSTISDVQLTSQKTASHSTTLSEEQFSTQTVEDSCYLCGGTETNRFVGFSVKLRFRECEIDWVNCIKCDKWFHLLCLGLEKEDIPEDDWYCETC